MLLLVVFFLAVNLTKINVNAESTAVINTTLGPVKGEILRTIGKGVAYSSFKGIRFGTPTSGRLRFKPADLAESWTDVMNATSKSPGCSQLTATNDLEGDEDCLFVNVFTPVTSFNETSNEPKAVMVWIFGGGFMRGSGDPDIYGPDFLIENDVVVITFNYRLGPLGFLALRHPEATGNVGLKDQQLVLKWINKNVGKFHGDPTRITIFGESAGGVCALYHTLADRSQGLFQRAISISGSPMNPWAFLHSSKAKKEAEKLAALLGQATNDDEQLFALFSNASARDLMYYSEQLGGLDPAFGPVIEDPDVTIDSTAFLTTCMIDKYESGNFSKVPYLLGFMKDETLAFTKQYLPELKNLAKSFADISNTTFAIPSVFNVPDDKWTWKLVQETSDLLFKAGIERVQRYITARSESLYYCEVTFAPLENSFHQLLFGVPSVGAAHTDVVAYMWWMAAGTFPLDPDDPISIARARMTRMLTNFAKYGNPTPDGTNDPLLNVTWPNYVSSKIHLDFGSDLRLGGLNFNDNTEAIIGAMEPLLATIKDCRV